MPNYKRMGRLTAWLLLICLAVTLVTPVLAVEIETEEDHAPAGLVVSQVRLNPYAGALVIGCLEDGTKLTVEGTANGFYRINCFDLTGYIAMSQVRQAGPEEYYVSCDPNSEETATLPSYSNDVVLALRAALRAEGLKHLGTRYVSGGTSPWGFDCSGLTQYIYAQQGLRIHRTVAAQLQNGVIIPKEELQCGDLVFFQNTTGYGHFASHVGIYIGNNQIVHAGDGGVGIADLDDPYFVRHYMCSRRVVLSEMTREADLPELDVAQNMNGSYWRENSQTDWSGDSFFLPVL